MDDKRRVRLSKFLSKHLRHQPERIGLTLDAAGWTGVDDLLRSCAEANVAMTRRELEEVVATNDKQRFAFDESGTRIRASQGHSIEVELGYEPQSPPETLFHGTVAGAWEVIRREGLKPMNRHQVHLSPDVETARRVGARRGRPLILRVAAREMHEEGQQFFQSENGVWLVDHVPPRFLSEISA